MLQSDATGAGYRILNTIYESSTTLVCRGTRAADGQTVILKIRRAQYATAEDLARQRREFEVVRGIDSPVVIKAHELAALPEGLAIVFEDFGGESLDRLAHGKRLPAAELLRIAIDCASALESLHDQHVTHKDVKPANLVYRREPRLLKLIDFGTCTHLAAEDVAGRADIFEGTLCYVSPEQTGRMNRVVDYRSDFYSLGVTLYELATGRLPFEAVDPLELVHCHIAKEPEPPELLNAELPRALSLIICKLLQKNAEDRYRSSSGLRHDLEQTLVLVESGRTQQTFALAAHDRPREFAIPQKLYGRADELKILRETFARVGDRGVQLLLVSGYSGIGKTALINEVYKPVTRRRGHFIAGKFDQLQRNVPYSAVVAAFRELIQQLLSEPEARLDEWRMRLKQALGAMGQVLTDVLPELVHIVGKQPAVPKLGPLETQSRFLLLFQRFVHAICQREHPLVVFLDDLQWIDAASLKLLESIMLDGAAGNLLVIGSYRDNEVDANHPLSLSLRMLEDNALRPARIELGPLEREHVAAMCADALACDVAEVLSLADMLIAKTGGNAFYISQFLRYIHKEEVLRFDTAQKRWSWDEGQLAGMAVAENVADLLARRFGEFPPQTRQALQRAACVGARFELAPLSMILAESLANTHAALAPAVQAQLIFPSTQLRAVEVEDGETELVYDSYRFLHDRVQAAAYASIPEGERETTHLEIGRMLVQGLVESELQERLFEVVDQLNAGARLIADPTERLRLADLNARAGLRAKDATAYAAAAVYLKAALAVDRWRDAPARAFELHMAYAEVAYLQGQLEVTDRVVALLLQKVRTPIEKAEVLQQRMRQYTLQNKHEAVLSIGAEALRLLGVEIPSTDLGPIIGQEFQRLAGLLAGRTVASLIELPMAAHPEHAMAMHILAAMQPSAYTINQQLYALINAKLVTMSLENGNMPESAAGYGAMGILIWAIERDYRQAYEFGKLAFRLSEKLHDRGQTCKAAVHFGSFVAPWFDHVRHTLARYDEGYRAGLEDGETQWAGFCLQFKSNHMLFLGVQLQQLEGELVDYLRFARQTHNLVANSFIRATRLPVWNLLGKTANESSFSDDESDQATYEALCRPTPTQFGVFLVNAALALCVQGQWERAFEYIARGAANLPFMPGMVQNALVCAIDALCLLRLKRAEAASKIAENQAQLAQWAELCPANFRHLYLWVEAERAASTGERGALDVFDDAIEAAAVSGYRNFEALIAEGAALYLLGRSKADAARGYLLRALNGYRAWGAVRKIEALSAQHRGALELASQSADPYASTTGNTTTVALKQGFDASTLAKASQTISAEVEIDKLAQRLLVLVLENAGAQRGALIVRDADGATVYARAAVNEAPDLARVALERVTDVPMSIVQFVLRTGNSVCIRDAKIDPVFSRDPKVNELGVRSVLALPMLRRGEIKGVIYAEHRELDGVFAEERMRVLQVVAAQAAISLDNAALYEELEAKVRERTSALAARNTAMRLVLDNVQEGLLTLDRSGRIAQERSAVVSQWFGAELGETFQQLSERFDPEFADSLAASWVQLEDGYLPIELVVHQLPARMHLPERSVDVQYTPILGVSGEWEKMLVILRDVTPELERKALEASQREIIAIFEQLQRDPEGFSEFCKEGARQVDEVLSAGAGLLLEKRHIHTLKGNCALLGVDSVARVCHEIEDAMETSGAGLSQNERARLAEAWSRFCGEVARFSTGSQDEIRIPRANYQALLARLEQRYPELIAELRSWTLEPTAQRLPRIAAQAEALAARLGKSPIDVVTEHNDIRLDAGRWSAFWSTFIHAIRNAIDHGLESPAEREAANKPLRGRICLRTLLHEGQLAIELEDNGRGIAWDALAAKAAQRGIAASTRAELEALLFMDGISTRDTVSEVSGRGVGMSALRATVQAMGGTIEIDTAAGRGTRFRFLFPVVNVASGRRASAFPPAL